MSRKSDPDQITKARTMAASSGAKIPSDETASDSVATKVAMTAADAITRLQKAAETVAADAETLQNTTTDKPALVARLHGMIAPHLARANADWVKAAAASVVCLAIALAAVLGLRDGARPEGARTAALDMARSGKTAAEEAQKAQEMRDQIRDLTQEVRGLRAQVQKQADEAHVGQARAAAAAATAAVGQAALRFEKVDRDTLARIDRLERDTGAKLEQQATRLERVERLTSDPVVTSSIPKSSTNPPAALKNAQGGDGYVLRGVHNGVATVQTRRGLIEVGPGDVIPGVGRVRSIEKVEGRWVVVTRDGVIDAD
jgi:hypothetical protein